MSSTPRTHAVGLFQVADPFPPVKIREPSHQITIPANTPNFATSHLCPAARTGNFPHQIHLFASLMHMHMMRKTIYTTLQRGGGATPENDKVLGGPNGQPLTTSDQATVVVKTEFFNHSKQHFSVFPEEVAFLPEDTLTTNCFYNNTSSRPVNFGPAMSDEMCMHVFLYYPRIEGLNVYGTSRNGVKPGNTVMCMSPNITLTLLGENSSTMAYHPNSVYKRTFAPASVGSNGSVVPRHEKRTAQPTDAMQANRLAVYQVAL